MKNKLFTTLFLVAVVIGTVPTNAVHAATTASLSSIVAGDLIRASATPAVYYYGSDGFRYVFPNDKTYFTWYTNFDNIKWVSDSDLGKIQIGGNVTYKPGVKMIKINTDPKTYAIDAGGSLRWVETEAAAVALYGANWNTQIDDMPDGFFSNYQSSTEDIATGTEFSPADAMTAATSIGEDRSLSTYSTVDITDYDFTSDSITIHAGDVVRFVNNSATNVHTATADDLSWGSGTINAGGGFWQHRFAAAGVYTYFCSYHPSMTGTITVLN